MAKPLSVV